MKCQNPFSGKNKKKYFKTSAKIFTKQVKPYNPFIHEFLKQFLPFLNMDTSTVWNGDWLCWGLTTRQPLWVILCRLPEKGRKEIEEIVEEMKERDR